MKFESVASQEANAWTDGVRVFVTTTLEDILSEEELQSTLDHEQRHMDHKATWTLWAKQVLDLIILVILLRGKKNKVRLYFKYLPAFMMSNILLRWALEFDADQGPVKEGRGEPFLNALIEMKMENGRCPTEFLTHPPLVVRAFFIGASMALREELANNS